MLLLPDDWRDLPYFLNPCPGQLFRGWRDPTGKGPEIGDSTRLGVLLLAGPAVPDPAVAPFTAGTSQQWHPRSIAGQFYGQIL
jgi:hypothetical protein